MMRVWCSIPTTWTNSPRQAPLSAAGCAVIEYREVAPFGTLCYSGDRTAPMIHANPEAVGNRHRSRPDIPALCDRSTQAQSEVFASYSGEDYYRNTFYSQNSIERNWSTYFDVLEYYEFGMNLYQHLVVMRSKGEQN